MAQMGGEMARNSGSRKAPSTKSINGEAIFKDHPIWRVHYGKLKRGRGRPGHLEHLFRVVAEKLPIEALPRVEKHMKAEGFTSNGIYVAHDSMGFPRYIGRGAIFNRLKSRFKEQSAELQYFSFYVVSAKKHEREIETLLIKAAGPLLQFNTRKKRVSIAPGDVRDYEAGTYFYERQYKRGR